MGIHSLPVTRIMIKFAIVVCLAAVVAADADADADPGLYYSGYGYLGHHYPYAYAHAPLVHHAVSPYVYGARYYANSGGAVHIVKRDADAEPAADAEPVADADADAYYAAYGYAYSPYVYRGYGYAHPISYARYYHPYAYAPYGYIRHLGKRSADAEPAA